MRREGKGEEEKEGGRTDRQTDRKSPLKKERRVYRYIGAIFNLFFSFAGRHVSARNLPFPAPILLPQLTIKQ